ncbi:MAG: putative extracellular repeat, family [Chthonomonadaceae bacterium]|nr:putative extracellular repeat, family [Chthonomonadaceae bacterium]
MSPLAPYRKPNSPMSFSRLSSLPACLRLWPIVVCLLLAAAFDAVADTALPENTIAPAFTLKDVDGASHLLTEYRGRPIVIFFACGCQWCHAFGVEWAQMQRSGVLTDATAPTDPNAPADASKPPLTLVVFMGDAAAARAYAVSTGLDLKQTVLLPDADYKVTRQYHALPCPRLYVLDGSGLLRYVNRHADDAPQKAAATVLVAKTIDGLRRTTLPPPPAPNLTKKPAPKSGKGGKSDSRK